MSAADRRRIAAELHDGALQEITLARLQLDLLEAGVRDDPALADGLAGVAGALQDASQQLHGLLRALGPDLELVGP